jgi:hypothetical protein
MKLSTLLPVFVFFFGLLFVGCQSVEEAEKVADQFFNAYNNEDADVMETLFDKETVIDAGITGDFYNVFDQLWQGHGKITSHKRYAFSTNTNNGLTIVTLKYESDTEKGTKVYHKLDFVKRGEEYKVYGYEFNINKTTIDNAK